ncbi:MAG: hypothetical protein ABIG61_02450 [Planctomycetota bacterium]
MMQGKVEENLEELLRRFYRPGESDEVLREIRAGDEIMRSYAGPEPDEELVKQIKADVAEGLKLRRAKSVRVRVYEAAAAIAVTVAAVWIGVLFFEGLGSEETARLRVPDTVWESEDLMADDAELSTLAAEMEEIERSMRAICLGESEGSNGDALVDIELELIEVQENFWKG